jgi:hypothetical protein
MASFVKYNSFIQELGRAGHNLNSDTLKVALTNTSPTVASNAVLSDITEISAGNGYSAGGPTVGSTSYSQSSGTGKLVGNDVTITASGGTIGPFRYAVVYNSTASSKLISYWDYGSALTLNDGESFTVDFSASNGILQIA